MNYDENESFFEGTIDSVIYHNPENGYAVFSVVSDNDNENEREEITCTGYMAQITPGEFVKLTGAFVLHPSYGRQFNVKFSEKSVPTSLTGIEKYLGSGVIKGIGERLARKITAEFGELTLRVFEEQPEKLSKIRGITLEKALQIGEVFREQAELRRAVIYLQEFGIQVSTIVKIYKKYGTDTIETVRTNPYALTDEIFGIGFKSADMIAFKVGILPDSPFRIRAGIRYILSAAASNGHVYLPKTILLSRASEELNLHSDIIENCLLEMQLQKTIWQEKINAFDETFIAVYLTGYYYAESYVAKKLIELKKTAVDKSVDVEKRLLKIQESSGLVLAKEQKQAVIDAVTNGVTIITGGPGTGKTTIINMIIKLLAQEGQTIALAAPTGRAAKKMSETTGLEAKTIHRLLELSFSDDDRMIALNRDEDSMIEADCVVIDESSMVDIMLMYNFLKAVNYGTRVIFVGDVDQLPSVGPGNVLKDMIESGRIHYVRLNEIFRQSGESAIILNAHRINNGLYPDFSLPEKDFFLIKRTNAEDVVRQIVSLVTERLPNYMKCDMIRDIQVLTPMRKGVLGVYNLNRILQERINPPAKNKGERAYRNGVFRSGDKIIQIKNNYNMVWKILDRFGRTVEEGSGVFNGDEGYILDINHQSEIVRVIYDDSRIISYDFSQLDEIELAYALTIHKSQGSEYKAVVIPLHSGPHMLMSRNLLYTAVTRAREMAVIVGIPETVNRMVDNNMQIKRYSSLNERIIKSDNFLN